MTRNYLLASAAALVCTPLDAVAQDAFPLDEIIISAAIEAAAAGRTGTTATVITREDLQSTAEVRLVDYLARVPGVGILTRGPMGTLSSITVRGASRNYVQVLVDGIDVTDPSGPQVAYDFGQLTTADVSRVEILRGTQSALYGSQAIGGVISITTLRAEEEGTTQSVSLESGSYNTVRGSYSLATRRGDGDLSATVSHISTDGFSAADEDAGNSEADGYSATRLSLAGGTMLDSGVKLSFSGFYEEGEGEYDEDFPAIADGSPDEENRFTNWGLRGAATFTTGAVDNEIALTHFDIERRDEGSTGFGATFFEYRGTRTALSYRAGADVAAGRLSFGGSLTEESYEQDSTFGANRGDNTVAAVFSEYAVAVGETLDVTGTLRVDSHSEYGEYLTGRVAAAWRVRPDVIVRASLGTGFRAPSNYELFGPFGDPALEPEESLSFDFGVEKRYGDRAAVRATLFYNETSNLIDFVGSGYTQIPGTVIRKGMEVEGSVDLTDRIALAANYTFTDAENPALSAGNTWNTSFGRHDLSISLDAEITDGLAGALTVQRVADRQTLPDYTLAHATLTYTVSKRAEAYLRVENLTDESYQLVQGYGTSDRAFYAGFRARF